MQNATNQKTDSPLKDKHAAAILVFLIMELFLVTALPALNNAFGLGLRYDGKAAGIYAGFLYITVAANSVIRRHRTSKPLREFVVEPMVAPQPAPAAVTTAAKPAKTEKPVVKPTQAKKVTFKNIAGYETTKESMAFIVQCLKNKNALSKIGSKIPAGILLYGPPGTGKTLMAAAIAGSAGVPMYSVNASAFINRYVGTGPASIRSLYEKARQNMPCVVFIDELDAIGGKRGAGDNEEYRSTINALLSELDGISGSAEILTIAATNRIEDLDPALIRPGRFDRKIAIPLPNKSDRKAILAVHAKNKRLAEDVDLDRLATDTEGYSGAALSTLLNEAGIYAVARGSDIICNVDIDKAMFRSTTGGEEVVSNNKNYLRITAWHEAGHAICMKLLCDRNVSRITIIGSTGGTNGITCSTNKEAKGTVTKKAMENLIKAVYGGRAAEEVLFGNADDITASASGDIRQATAMIRDYITTYGMGSGLLNISVFTGENGTPTEYIEEANALAERLYRETVDFLTENKDLLERVANELLKKKTLGDEELTELVQNK